MSMTEVYNYRIMMNEDEDETLVKCREQRRRRRREMRRLALTPAADSGSEASMTEESTDRAEGKKIRPTETVDILSSSGEDTMAFSASPPEAATMSVSGRCREMEDAVCVRTDICRPEINGRRPVHFYGVFDGHGGSHVAALCRERMHVLMEEELKRAGRTANSERGAGLGKVEEGLWRAAIGRCFERMDEVALNTCACRSVGQQCGCHPMESAFTGSTAIVAVVTANHIIVANCGDSRAVLCRAGRAVPLSSDHKPDRPDERARIEASGGRVIFVNGARVQGILAMSRAIGDKFLKASVTSEPEITFTRRDPKDDCLILASDGLWDVMSNELVCQVASECLREGTPPSAQPRIEDEGARTFYSSRSASAAALLTRLALGRKSTDNISVIVADLKRSLS